ncbi:hypothetical protein BDN72DRAFT_675146 [Pluteus cervinus]|uniref:Uncharacterized protein n=1 Tax=Pluteus cervinus TaxID=181527 RepID=A0ACD3ARH2_9AGAR|nr:hypothetical protein BDN72DRAFT_675146 [Pluteus cervinus]
MYAFLAMQMIGLFGNAIVLLTVIISKNLTRQPTWINFSVGWIISTLSYCLLLFAGMVHDYSPPHNLCVVQAALIYAVPPFTAAMTLGLAIEVWLNVRKVLKLSTPQNTWTRVLLIFPYILLIAFFIAWLVTGLKNSTMARRKHYKPYCDFASHDPSTVSAGAVLVIMLPTVAFEFSAVFSLFCDWNRFRDRQGSLSAVIRIISFTICGVIGMVVGWVFMIMKNHGPGLNIAISILPVVAALIFGSQSDILRVWMFWSKPPEAPTLTLETAESIDAYDRGQRPRAPSA